MYTIALISLLVLTILVGGIIDEVVIRVKNSQSRNDKMQ